jgi:Choline kinase N terminus
MAEILSSRPECFEYSEEDLVVPSCEATLSAFSARAPSTCPSKGSSFVIWEAELASQEAVFKAEVLEIAQTLNLNGWN